jgi:hypothetical protein
MRAKILECAFDCLWMTMTVVLSMAATWVLGS